MRSNLDADELLQAEPLEALPTIFAFLRSVVSSRDMSPEREELRKLIEACVVGAHRLRLAEQLRARKTYGYS